MTTDLLWILSLLVTALHGLGILSAVDALMSARSPQGAIAWAFALTTVPYVALPAYWVFGRRRFHGYVVARRLGYEKLDRIVDRVASELTPYRADLSVPLGRFQALENLVKLPFTRGNDVRLLIDGDAIHAAMLEAIAAARESVLVQFYIVRHDETGRELAAALKERAAAGVRVHFLYDEIGSYELSEEYLDDLRASGAEVHAFHSRRGRRNRFQINFRNHRKVVVVDGEVAFVGGANVGDEYRGRDPRFGRWRDTHLRLEGPAAVCAQLSFLEDWYWSTRTIPELRWRPVPSPTEDRSTLILATGPADVLESCGLFFVHAIHAARRRLWIATPYFVPDSSVLHALQLAALRGVDVRVLVPENPDHKLVHLASCSYLGEVEPAGVKVLRYTPGFLHQKVVLVDDDVAAVGTANLDNRSFRLNFELMAVVADGAFAREVEEMLEADLANASPFRVADLEAKPLWFRIAVRLARLFAPIL